MSDLDKNIKVKVLDISAWQSNTVNFEQLVKDGYWGVIIRINDASKNMTKDPCFEMNYSLAKKAGLHVGGYWYTRALNTDFALKESEKCFEYCKGKQFDLPIYVDIEESEQFALGKTICTQIVSTILVNLQKKYKMFVGVYCSTFYTEQYLDKSITDYYAMWIAQWGDVCTYKGQYGMWQTGYAYTKGVDGGRTPVDNDICYVDYPTAIKARGMNGYSQAELDRTALYTYGTTDWAIYCIKETMLFLYDKGYMKTKVDANYISYTEDLEKAVNELLAKWNYKPNGILGKNFLINLYTILRGGKF